MLSSGSLEKDFCIASHIPGYACAKAAACTTHVDLEVEAIEVPSLLAHMPAIKLNCR